MEHFEIGCCFKSYAELTEKLKEYCSETYTKFTTKDCRLIKDEFMDNIEAKNRLMYTDLKIICVHGRTNRPKKLESKRKRSERKYVDCLQLTVVSFQELFILWTPCKFFYEYLFRKHIIK